MFINCINVVSQVINLIPFPSPVLGLGVLIFLLVVAVTLQLGGQSRVGHLRVVAH